MFRIHLSKPKSDQAQTPRSQADQAAIRYGLFTAVVIVIYNLLLHLFGNGGFEFAHLAIFLLLFLMIGYGLQQNRQWIRMEHAMDDRMLFGLVLSIITSFGIIAMNGLLVIIDYHLLVSPIFLPINNAWKFAVNSMALFWCCLVFGFLSTFILIQWFGIKDEAVS